MMERLFSDRLRLKRALELLTDGGRVVVGVRLIFPTLTIGRMLASSTETGGGEGAGDSEDGKFRLGDIRLKGAHQWLDGQEPAGCTGVELGETSNLKVKRGSLTYLW